MAYDFNSSFVWKILRLSESLPGAVGGVEGLEEGLGLPGKVQHKGPDVDMDVLEDCHGSMDGQSWKELHTPDPNPK